MWAGVRSGVCSPFSAEIQVFVPDFGVRLVLVLSWCSFGALGVRLVLVLQRGN